MKTVFIDMDRTCAECKKKGSGVTANGLCLTCTTKAIQRKPMKSAQGAAVAARFDEIKRGLRR